MTSRIDRREQCPTLHRKFRKRFSRFSTIFLIITIGILSFAQEKPQAVPGVTSRLSYETEADILSDFLSSARIYREAKPGRCSREPARAPKAQPDRGQVRPGAPHRRRLVGDQGDGQRIRDRPRPHRRHSLGRLPDQAPLLGDGKDVRRPGHRGLLGEAPDAPLRPALSAFPSEQHGLGQKRAGPLPGRCQPGRPAAGPGPRYLL